MPTHKASCIFPVLKSAGTTHFAAVSLHRSSRAICARRTPLAPADLPYPGEAANEHSIAPEDISALRERTSGERAAHSSYRFDSYRYQEQSPSPDPRKMLVAKKKTALELVEQPQRFDLLRGAAAFVKSARLGEVIAVPSRLSCTQAEVNIVHIDEKALVEAAELAEKLGPDEEERAHDLIYKPALMGIGGGEEPGEEPRKKAGESRRVSEIGVQKRKVHAARLGISIVIDQANAAYSDILRGLGFHEREGPSDAAVEQAGIRIEKQKIRRGAPLRAEVTARGETEIAARPYQFQISRGIADPVRAVRRIIVDDDHFRHRIPISLDRGEALLEKSSRIPIYDDHVAGGKGLIRRLALGPGHGATEDDGALRSCGRSKIT